MRIMLTILPPPPTLGVNRNLISKSFAQIKRYSRVNEKRSMILQIELDKRRN